MERASRSTVTTIVCVVVLMTIFIQPASAKMLPLEVQVTGADRTVRIDPATFFSRINVADGSGVARPYGVFEYLSGGPSESGRTAFTISLRYMYDGRGSLTDDPTQAIRRDTVVVVTFIETPTGAVGRIQPGGEDPSEVGRWVRFLPAFSELVTEAYRTGVAVEPLHAPPYMYERPIAEPYASLRRAAIDSYGLLLVAAFLALCLILNRVGRKVRKHRRSRRTSWEPITTRSIGRP